MAEFCFTLLCPRNGWNWRWEWKWQEEELSQQWDCSLAKWLLSLCASESTLTSPATFQCMTRDVLLSQICGEGQMWQLGGLQKNHPLKPHLCILVSSAWQIYWGKTIDQILRKNNALLKSSNENFLLGNRYFKKPEQKAGEGGKCTQWNLSLNIQSACRNGTRPEAGFVGLFFGGGRIDRKGTSPYLHHVETMVFPSLDLREDLGRTMSTGTDTREVFASLWLPADATLLVFHHSDINCRLKSLFCRHTTLQRPLTNCQSDSRTSFSFFLMC